MQTLLLLHGWNQNPDCFSLIKPLLEKKYEILSPVMPGFDQNKLKKPYDLDQYADWLENFISKNETTNLIILGHSFGGAVCIKFLSKYPNKNIKLILVDAAIVKDRYSFRKKIHYFLIYKLKPFFIFLNNSTDNQNINSSVMKKTFQNVAYLDLITEATKIDNKTLIIWGNHDIVTPLKFGKKINKKMKDSTIKIISNSGHFPFIDKPEIFVSCLD